MKEFDYEKAKAYDKVREKIALRFGSNVAEEIFSEFEESEGEKIRKEISELIMQPTWKTEKEFNRRKELIAWLEKQGQVKDSSIFQHEIETCKENNDSLTSEEEKTREIIRLALKSCNTGQGYIVCNDDYTKCLAWLEKQGERKPDWSEEDEKILKNLIDYFCLDDCLQLSSEETVDWLKSLKDRLKRE